MGIQKKVVTRKEITEWLRNRNRIGAITISDKTIPKMSLQRRNLDYLRFIRCDLTEVDFTGASMFHAVFIECKLVKCDFSKTKMPYSELRESKLIGTKFREADAEGSGS